MQNLNNDPQGAKTLDAKVREFFLKLRGYFAPRYVPQKTVFANKDQNDSIGKA